MYPFARALNRFFPLFIFAQQVELNVGCYSDCGKKNAGPTVPIAYNFVFFPIISCMWHGLYTMTVFLKYYWKKKRANISPCLEFRHIWQYIES